MLFNSYVFGIFFLVVYSLYLLSQRHYKVQNLILLAASYLFYGWWDVRFLFLIILSTVVDYLCSLGIDRKDIPIRYRIAAYGSLLIAYAGFVLVNWDVFLSDKGPAGIDSGSGLILWTTWRGWGLLLLVVNIAGFEILRGFGRRLPSETVRKMYLIYSVTVNLAILGFFKYFHFFTDNLRILLENLFHYTLNDWTVRVVLPVGISFFTFQTMSHTIDVYRRKIPASESLIELAVYVAFFPQLVAGPIERGEHLLPQFQRPRILSREAFREGLWLIVWGLYKKVVVADNLARLVNQAFGPYDKGQFSAGSTDGLYLLLAVYAFAFQIYGDFSGYTDIARGTAKLMGFDIMLNFNLPYFSKTPSEFWQRWHISLSSWLRDYLYIPLGGNRSGTWMTYRNLLITMLLGGLWHGAAWTFVLWGAFHGLILVIYRVFSVGTQRRGFFLSLLQGLLMFHLVCLGWLLFRSQNLPTVWLILRSILSDFSFTLQGIEAGKELVYYVWFLAAFQVFQYFSGDLWPIRRWPWMLRAAVWVYLGMSLLRLSAPGGQEFIYFAF
ncbi:MAG TPA: MBOAT family O-acyltransferase [Anaerohalosphaeraceae bacterium]|nr:MBOAT family O-acyltransferase [Anaerohalosphaeraceae bacterium]